MNINMYVMAHKKYNEPEIDGYKTLQVGAALNPDIGYISDDEGDNISVKNKSFCELTGLYWLWKNVSQTDIIGISHYRRYFFEGDEILSVEKIAEIFESYDAVVPISSATKEGSLLNQYQVKHNIGDIEICAKIIKEKFPEYYSSFMLVMCSNLFNVGNMIILRKHDFDSYCQWLFDILFEAEKRIDICDRDDYQKRVFGFLAERLLRVWLMNQHMRIKEVPVFRVNDMYQKEKEISDI